MRSPLKVAPLESLRAAFREVPDPRAATSRRHPLAAMLGLIALGLLMGARDVLDIWRKVAGLSQRQRQALGLCVRDQHSGRLTMPGYDALNDLLVAVDPAAYVRALTAFLQAHAGRLPRSLALDGKSVGNGRCGMIITLCRHEDGRPVAMTVARGKKEDCEVSAGRALLADPQVERVNALVTADPLHNKAATVRVILDKGGDYLIGIKANTAQRLAGATQGQMEAMTETAKSFGAKGLAYIKVENGEWKSPIVKFFSDAEKQTLIAKLRIEEGDLILFAADQWLAACEILGKIRLYCADVLKTQGKLTIPADQFNFLWVIEFPLLGFDREQNRWYSSHHPFTAPVTDDIPLLKSDPKKVRGQHYDIVVNGVELGGGSIRIHQPDVQKTIFEELLQIPPDLVKARFGYMLEAFKYGAPPHGGIALGFDRLIAILCNTPSIRDVIAFPKTAKGTCLMTDSPSTVEPKQLRDLHIELKVKYSVATPQPALAPKA